ncbi:MAG: HlyD family efflux transporter periplasmic adaptor subunit [Chlorobi bacterium]|nr:HlyD family efflux transporter periplasmic adaptor subunit [Chlorobiota bacterium]
MNKRTLTIAGSVVIILVAAVIFASILAKMKKKSEEKTTEKIVRYVKAVPVKYETVNTELKATGRVTSQNYVDLSSEVRGKILPGQVNLKKGQNFKRGQILLRIYDEEAKLALQAHKSRFLSSLANILPDLKTDFKDSYDKWLDFFNKTDTKKDIPELPEIKSEKEKIYLSGRNILSDWYSIKTEEINLKKYRIAAPFNGTFTDVYAEPGAIASPGIKIARMIRTDKLELEVPVESKNIIFLKKGQQAEIISGDKNFKGKILRISNFVDAKTQSVPVFVDISGIKNKHVYQGEYMTAVFSGITLKNVFKIPREAVFNQNQVFIVKNNKLKKENINIQKTDDTVIFFNGLPEGTLVVNEALINAVENTEVKIIK